jgi:NAD-dependent deacetylase
MHYYAQLIDNDTSAYFYAVFFFTTSVMALYDILIQHLVEARNVAIFTGAGISAESGIATFRDPDGLWSKFNPTELASMKGFLRNPERVWQWYNYRRAIIADAQPNAGHIALAELERNTPNCTVITQNVDRLHQRAGTKNILELHGNIIDNHCVKCSTPYTHEINIQSKELPLCNACGGNIRPSVVWFGENLPDGIFEKAEYIAGHCDVFFSIGTSAEVYPAAYLPFTAKNRGAFCVEINPTPTPFTPYSHLAIQEKSGECLPRIVELLQQYHSL